LPENAGKNFSLKSSLIQPNDTKSIVMEGAEFMQKTGGVVCKLCRTFHCDCPRNDDEAKKSGK
jgi:Ca2+ transporting ATPase